MPFEDTLELRPETAHSSNDSGFRPTRGHSGTILYSLLIGADVSGSRVATTNAAEPPSEIAIHNASVSNAGALHARYVDFQVSRPYQVVLDNDLVTTLPAELADLYEAIEDSKKILALPIDEEVEDGEKYDCRTWLRAIRWIGDYAMWYFDRVSGSLDIPEIYDGPGGSIDILWERPHYRLLINIPSDYDQPASFYGDDYRAEKIKGTFEPTDMNRHMFVGLLSKGIVRD